MGKLPVVSGKKLLQALLKNEFVAVRRKGSHVFTESADGTRGTVIPVHGNEDLGTGLLRSILHDLDLSVDELLKLLRKRS
jgi:predicted RNA binding protein YcfA (HicA-like mRNA interferase family)